MAVVVERTGAVSPDALPGVGRGLGRVCPPVSGQQGRVLWPCTGTLLTIHRVAVSPPCLSPIRVSGLTWKDRE